MSEKRFIVESVEIFECGEFDKRIVKAITDKNELYTYSDIYEIADLLNELAEENEQLKNELRKEKSLREYSDSMYDVDLIVNIRFSNGEWKADVSVIDDE